MKFWRISLVLLTAGALAVPAPPRRRPAGPGGGGAGRRAPRGPRGGEGGKERAPPPAPTPAMSNKGTPDKVIIAPAPVTTRPAVTSPVRPSAGQTPAPPLVDP